MTKKQRGKIEPNPIKDISCLLERGKFPIWFGLSLYLGRALLVHVREGRREEREEKGKLC